MRKIDTIEALEALYDAPHPAAIRKVARRLTPLYRTWIEAARFCIVSTVGPDGTDGTPRQRRGAGGVALVSLTLMRPSSARQGCR